MLTCFHDGRFGNFNGTEELTQDVSTFVVLCSELALLSDVCFPCVEVWTVAGSRTREGIDGDGSTALVEVDGHRSESGELEAVAEGNRG